MPVDERSGLRSVAARRREWRERQQRSRENRRTLGIPRQDQIDAAVMDAFSWCIRRQLCHRTRVRDLVEGGLQVDVEVVIARAIQTLSGYTGPKTGDPALKAAAKVIGARVVKRICEDRIWWVGNWAVPRGETPIGGDDEAHGAGGPLMADDGDDMGGMDDFEPMDGDARADYWETVSGPSDPMDGPSDDMEFGDPEEWAAFLAECDASDDQ